MNSAELLSKFKTGETINRIVFEETIILDLKDVKEVHSIYLNKCEFKGGFQLSNIPNDGVIINISDCKFYSSFILKNSTIFELDVYNSKFGSINISNLKCVDIHFRELRSLGIVNIYNVEADNFGIANVIHPFKGKLRINSDAIDDILIYSRKQFEEIQLIKLKNITIQGDVNHMNLFLDKIESLNIDGYFIDDLNKNDWKKSVIQKFSYNNSNLDGNIIVSDTVIQKLYFSSVTSSGGSIRFNEIEIANANFIDCSIANFYWNQVSFINDPQIVGCDFSTLKMANVDWRDPKKLNGSWLDKKVKLFYGLRKKRFELDGLSYSQEEISDLQYQRETYRQLKVTSISSHNKIDALLFYRNEMRLYWKEVRINGGIPRQNRIIIFLDRWTSDFGQNWLLPLCLLLFFHFVLTASIFNWELTLNWKNAEFGVGEYFNLLNPVHKTPCYISSGFEKIMEFVMRLLGGYFIYHFIRAIRKYGKL